MYELFRRYVVRLGAISALMVIGGCGVAIPVHDAQPPYVIGGGGFRLTELAAMDPMVGPELAGTGITSTKGKSASTSFGFGVSVGLTDRLDLDLREGVSLFGGAFVRAGLKYQFLGPNLHQLKGSENLASIRAEYLGTSGFKDKSTEANNGDLIFDDIFVEKMEGSGYGLTFNFGRQVNTWFGSYLAARWVDMDLEAKFRQKDNTGPLYEKSRKIQGYGPLLGLYLNPRFTLFGVKSVFEWVIVEYNWMNLPLTFEKGRAWYTGTSSSMSLGFYW